MQVETERARNLSECLPAELDPGGHWGPISDGAQLSARLTTNVFAAGQPITLSLILRNTTTGTASPSLALACLCWILVLLRENSGPLTPTNTAMRHPVSMAGGTALPPGRQNGGCPA